VASTMEVVNERIYSFLSGSWKASRFLDPVTYKEGFFGRRYAMEGVGLSIGTRGASYLYLDKPLLRADGADVGTDTTSSSTGLRGLSPKTVEDAFFNLRKFGMCVINQGLTTEQVKEINARLHLNGTSAPLDKILEQDANVASGRPTRGRMHCILRGTSFQDGLVEYQRLWMPIIYSALPTTLATPDSPDTPHRHGASNSVDRLFVSEIQLVVADPLAAQQSWHMDNSKPGLTVVVPLVDFKYGKDGNGSMEVQPGTHLLRPNSVTSRRVTWLERVKNTFNAFHVANGVFALSMNVGDICIYDSRLLHRGLENESWASTPMLVFRYDYERTPPPQQSILDGRIAQLQGNFYEALAWIYRHL